ncbi:uncharacterized protein CLUP02_17088 [Colletotrichum lupini]|uniref:Secreted protein n=1 Tax=Colletotrichum lupini TaxID=145971 RepID=A0A9Q8WQL5_9PEZI|nr:uncharacterized protein CLUP02_17088 [Colletotrichum lupini]UQC91552.1 hypothetical protein CLUP02_17088 [Colletotrichum lupini]
MRYRNCGGICAIVVSLHLACCALSAATQDPLKIRLTRSNYMSSSTRLAKAMTITNVHCGTLVSSNDSLGQVAETLYQGSFGPRPLCTSPVPPCNPPRFRQIRVSATTNCIPVDLVFCAVERRWQCVPGPVLFWLELRPTSRLIEPATARQLSGLAEQTAVDCNRGSGPTSYSP